MLALGFGLTAALIWALHDLFARKLTQGAALLPLVAVVLGTGCIALLPIALIWGDWAAMSGAAWRTALMSGIAFAVAISCLYKTFSLAPVRLVSPVIGSYPLLTLLIALAHGRSITPLDMLAVLLIVVGVAIVAMSSRDDAPEGYAAPPRVALGWAALSALGFAATFALAQAASRLGSDLPVILIGRLSALSCVAALMLWGHGPLRLPRGQTVILSLMGVFDALALALVTAAGTLPKAEYAAVTSSLFGILTVLLAAWFLREGVRGVQWFGIAVVFTGIAGLGLQGG